MLFRVRYFIFLRIRTVSTKLDCFYVGTVVSTCAALYGRTCPVDMNFGCFYEVGLFLSFSVVSTKKNCFLELFLFLELDLFLRFLIVSTIPLVSIRVDFLLKLGCLSYTLMLNFNLKYSIPFFKKTDLQHHATELKEQIHYDIPCTRYNESYNVHQKARI